MVMPMDHIMGMTVGRFILPVDMTMGMGVFMFMGVNQIAVAVFVTVDMGMIMGVLEGNGILHHQHCCGGHDDKANPELHTGPLPQQERTKHHAQKRGDGIVGACFGSTQIFLRLDIKINGAL